LFHGASDDLVQVLVQLILLDTDDLTGFCLFVCARGFAIVHL
jgi:hypothetical protein